MQPSKTTRERLDDRLDWGFLALGLLVLVAGPFARGGASRSVLPVLHWLIVAAAALWAVRLWFNPRRLLLWTPASWAALGFLGYVAVRFAVLSARGSVDSFARTEFAGQLAVGLLFFVLMNNLHRQADTPILATALLLTGGVIATLSVIEWLKGAPLGNRGRLASPGVGGVISTYPTPETLAGLLELLLPLAFAYALSGRFPGSARVCLAYGGVVMLVGILLSLCFGAWLAVVACGTLLLVALCRQYAYRRPALIVLAVTVVTGAIYVTQSLQYRYRFEETFRQVTDLNRYSWWTAAARAWFHAPLFGLGPGGLARQMETAAAANRAGATEPNPPRNDLLELAANHGLVGVLFAAAVLAFVLLAAVRAWKVVKGGTGDLGGKRSNRAGFVLGAAVGVAALALHTLLDDPLSAPANLLAVSALMGLLAAHERFCTTNWWIELNWVNRGVITALILGVATWLGWLTFS